jgi:hypothetical protein
MQMQKSLPTILLAILIPKDWRISCKSDSDVKDRPGVIKQDGSAHVIPGQCGFCEILAREQAGESMMQLKAIVGPVVFAIFAAFLGSEMAAAKDGNVRAPAVRTVAADPRMPNSQITQKGGDTAWLIDPVATYDHHVFGDELEPSGFAIQFKGRMMTYKLGPDAIFEDRKVQLEDINGDGSLQAIVVKTYLAKGSALAVYDMKADGIRPTAETPAIGAPHSWLYPVGVLRTQGQPPVIAAVITPHQAGSLRFYQLKDGKLIETGRLEGYTNHVFGSHNVDMARIGDLYGDKRAEIIIPNLARDKLAVISNLGGKPVLSAEFPVNGHISGVDRIGKNFVWLRLDGGGIIELKIK